MPYRFTHDISYILKSTGEKHTHKEEITDGEEQGLDFKFVKLEGAKYQHIKVKEDATKRDNFVIKKKIDKDETSEKINLKDLLKILKENKNLEFVISL